MAGQANKGDVPSFPGDLASDHDQLREVLAGTLQVFGYRGFYQISAFLTDA